MPPPAIKPHTATQIKSLNSEKIQLLDRKSELKIEIDSLRDTKDFLLDQKEILLGQRNDISHNIDSLNYERESIIRVNEELQRRDTAVHQQNVSLRDINAELVEKINDMTSNYLTTNILFFGSAFVILSLMGYSKYKTYGLYKLQILEQDKITKLFEDIKINFDNLKFQNLESQRNIVKIEELNKQLDKLMIQNEIAKANWAQLK
jgi:hypothetical protein